MSADLRAENTRSIFFFTESGITIVQILSLARQVAMILAFTILYSLVFVGTLTIGTGLPTEALLLSLVIGMGVVIGSSLLIPEVIRRHLLKMPLEDLGRRVTTILIPWDRVEEVRIGKGLVSILAGSKRYRVFSRKNQKELESFLEARIGEKLNRKASHS